MAYNVKKHGEERTGLLDNGFPLDEDDETALLEASTGFSVLDEEDEDVSEMLRVLERQESTLQVQLDNLWDSLTELEEQEGRQGQRYLRTAAQIEGLTARIQELEEQINGFAGQGE